MLKLCSSVLFLMAFYNTALSQNADSVRYIDSLVGTKEVVRVSRKVPVSYTAGYHARALVLQQAFGDAALYYENIYHKKFNVKLAVLDSAHWLTERVPFGFLNYENGWAQIPAHMDFAAFLRLYGIEDNRAQLERLMKIHNVNSEQLMNSVFLVYSLHELGHYFIIDLNQCETADLFSDELIATYFSYNFFKHRHSGDLQTLVWFSAFIAQTYQPKYREIEAMDSLYTKMPIQNFKWFHCNIVLLCDRLSPRNKGRFISNYLHTFAKGTKTGYTTAQMIALLDKNGNGIVADWAKSLKKAQAKQGR